MDPYSVQHIAFYGSLMAAHGKQLDLQIAQELELIGPCQIFGELYDMGDYPALIVSCDSRVQGELYRIKDPAVLPKLDVYEDFDSEDEAKSLYVRRVVRLAEPVLDCWIYVYNGNVSGHPRVISGRW